MDYSDKDKVGKLFLSLAQQLQHNFGYSKEELLQLLFSEDTTIPVTAFYAELTPLESIARFMRDRQATEVARLLKRPKAAIQNALENSYKKLPQEQDIKPTPYLIPLEIFSDRALSMMEHLCTYLKDKYGLRNNEIAQLIGKNQRTVWTVLNRAKEKQEGSS